MTGGLIHLDAHDVAAADLGRGRRQSHHYLKEVCTIMKLEHSANALARGPPVLIRAGRSGNAAEPRETVCVLATHHRGRSGVPILQARVQDADIAGLPGEISREGPLACQRTGRIHNPQSQTTRKQNASRKD